MKRHFCFLFLIFVIPLFTAGGESLSVKDDFQIIQPEDFRKVNDETYVTSIRQTDFKFNEAIYSWNIKIPEKQGFRLFFRVIPDKGNPEPWLYAGYWGGVKPRGDDIRTEFEHGRMLYDHILLDKKYGQYQFRIVDKGEKSLSLLPSMRFVYTEDERTTKTTGSGKSGSGKGVSETIVLDVPFRSQHATSGEHIPDTCQSAALASAMQYFGKEIPLEGITKWTGDPEYDLMGIWPRTIGTGAQFGLAGYIDRFRTWDKVAETLSENKIILASLTMPEEGDYIDPPYPRMSGHIVALCGVTDDGRVIVEDSALSKNNKGHRLQWLIPDFEKIWMDQKGGVGMVIYSKDDMPVKKVNNIPDFQSYKETEEKSSQ